MYVAFPLAHLLKAPDVHVNYIALVAEYSLYVSALCGMLHVVGLHEYSYGVADGPTTVYNLEVGKF